MLVRQTNQNPELNIYHWKKTNNILKYSQQKLMLKLQELKHIVFYLQTQNVLNIISKGRTQTEI